MCLHDHGLANDAGGGGYGVPPNRPMHSMLSKPTANHQTNVTNMRNIRCFHSSNPSKLSVLSFLPPRASRSSPRHSPPPRRPRRRSASWPLTARRSSRFWGLRSTWTPPPPSADPRKPFFAPTLSAVKPHNKFTCLSSVVF